MDTDPFYDSLARIFPSLLLIALGIVCIYSVIGVPIGLFLIGSAIALAITKYHPIR